MKKEKYTDISIQEQIAIPIAVFSSTGDRRPKRKNNYCSNATIASTNTANPHNHNTTTVEVNLEG